MNVFELAAKLTLDTSEYESNLSGALGTAKKIGSGIGSGLATIGKTVAAGIAAGTAAVGAFAATSVNAGMDFDSAMSQVAATMGTTVDNIQNLRDFAQEMGSTTAFSATESAEALNYMALAGYDAETSMQMLPNVLNLAAAGGIELAEASDMVTDAQTALGLSIDETTVMVDQMAKASSKTNTSVAQLGEAFLTIGGNAKNLSGGTAELSQMLGVLADNGIKGSEAGTHLRNIMLAMTPSTEDAAAAWEKLGVDAYDADGNLRPLQDTFTDLSKAMEGMTDQEKTNTINAMFNKTDLASVNALLDTTSDRYDEIAEALDGAQGAAEEMANTQLDNLEGDITLFKSALEGAQIAISDQLTPTLREFVQFGSDGLSRITEAFKEGGLDGAMAEFGSILSDGIAMITEMMPQLIEAGSQLLTALIQGIVENLPQIIEATVQIIGTLTQALIENMPLILQGGMELLAGLLQGIVDNLPTLLDAAMQMIQTIAQGLVDNLPTIIESAMQMILTLALGIAEALPELIPEIVNIMITIVDTLIENIDLLVEAALEIIIALTEGIMNALPQLIAKLPELVLKIVTKLIELAPQLAKAAVKMVLSLIDGLVQSWTQLLTKLPQLVTQIKETFVGQSSKFGQMGIEMVKAIWEGIKERWNKLKDDVSDLWNSLTGLFSGGKSSKSNSANAAANAMNSYAGTAVSATSAYTSGSQQAESNTNINVGVTLEGDAKRLFRVVQQQAQINEQLTGAQFAF